MHFVVCKKVETIILFCDNLLKMVRKVFNWVCKRGTFSVQNGISKGKGFGLDLGTKPPCIQVC